VTLERDWLLGAARSEREAMGRTIQYTEPEHWAQDSILPGWRNRDIVAHLAASDVAAAAAVAGEPPAELEAYRTQARSSFSVDGFNAEAIARRAGEPLRAVIGEWGQAVDLFLARTAQLSLDEWATRRAVWVAGQIRLPYLVQARIMEWWLHGEDIRAGADLPKRREHEPMFCANDLAIRMIPYALSVAGRSFPGKSMRFKIEGAGGGEWHYGLAPRETPAAGKRPDAGVEALGYDFALLAGRRIPARELRAAGAIIVTGDVNLADTVLDSLRAFAV
jgi:uncharacterized protein (TIGR03083 family)